MTTLMPPPIVKRCLACGHTAHGVRPCGVATMYTGTCRCTLATVDVYVPKPGCLTHIAKGSAIVGSAYSESEVLIDYEGNLYDAENMRRYSQRVAHAADRHNSLYPTTARMVVVNDDLIRVGTFSSAFGLDLLDETVEAMQRWLEDEE